MSAVLGLDPMLILGVGAKQVLIVLIKVVVAFVVLLVAVILMIWFERKIIADMQNRIGPNSAGPWGILQTLADGIKLFFKEDILPSRPTGSCSGWRPTSPSCPRSSRSPSCPSAATSRTATTAW